jgi:hypothetical protein
VPPGGSVNRQVRSPVGLIRVEGKVRPRLAAVRGEERRCTVKRRAADTGSRSPPRKFRARSEVFDAKLRSERTGVEEPAVPDMGHEAGIEETGLNAPCREPRERGSQSRDA